MEPTSELIDALYCEEVLEACSRPPAEKLLDGARLFDRICSIMCSGIRDEHPSADEVEVRRILDERLELARRLEGVW